MKFINCQSPVVLDTVCLTSAPLLGNAASGLVKSTVYIEVPYPANILLVPLSLCSIMLLIATPLGDAAFGATFCFSPFLKAIRPDSRITTFSALVK